MKHHLLALSFAIGFLCQCTAPNTSSMSTAKCSSFEPINLAYPELLNMSTEGGEPFVPERKETVALFLSHQICMDCLILCLEYFESTRQDRDFELVGILQPGMLEGSLMAQHRLKRLPPTLIIDWDNRFEGLPITLASIDWNANKIHKSYQPEKHQPVSACLDAFLEDVLAQDTSL